MNEIQKSISKVQSGLIVQLVSSIVIGIFSSIFAFVIIGASALSTMADDPEDFIESLAANNAIAGVTVIILFVAAVIYLIAYSLYRKGNKKFATFLDPLGSNAASQMALSAKLNISSMIICIVGFILCGVVGAAGSTGASVALIITAILIVGILSLIGYVLNIIGMINLKQSSILNEYGQVGARQISTAAIFSICQIFVGFIPFVGIIFNVVLGILYWVFVLSGWSKIKKSFA